MYMASNPFSKAVNLYSLRPYALLLLGLCLVFLSACSEPKGRIALNKPLPSVMLAMPGGGQVQVPAGIDGQLTAFLFWRQGCAFCKKEMPLMEPLYQRLKGKGFNFVGIHLGEASDEVSAMVRDNGLTFPMLMDAEEVFKDRYGVRYVPLIVFINSSGVVVEKILGGVGAADLERIALERLEG